ncbi:potassium channel family protein [Paracoccus jiaweipingae]|uniref:potassium channel family protein n=1 Tax=unclassified Paracoccus (in: a-proteobacteria) TaxID=2688777 RepID=UPI003795E379
MTRKGKSFATIGLGAFGGTVATELQRIGNRVLGIDSDARRVSQYVDQLSETAILDASDETALREVGLDRYDMVLIAIGDSIEASLLATMNARLLGVPEIWVKASSRTHHRILTKLGVDRVLLPEHEMGRHIAQVMNNPVVQDYVSLGNGFSVVHIAVPPALAGRSIPQLELPSQGLRALGVMRGTEFLAITDPTLTLAEDDKLLILGKRPELRRFGDSL